MSNVKEKLKKGQNLSFEESKILFSELMEGKHNESSIIDILENLLAKGETKDELAGGIYVLREKASKVNTDENTIDTCGTGGDGQNSLNISTAAAIVLASMGVKVAKHGNKAVSSNCGSADVLEALKININLSPKEAEENIKKFNFAFMFAPMFASLYVSLFASVFASSYASSIDSSFASLLCLLVSCQVSLAPVFVVSAMIGFFLRRLAVNCRCLYSCAASALTLLDLLAVRCLM